MLDRRSFLAAGAAFVTLAALGAGPLRADAPMVYARRGVAIGGYDPVAYFTESRPVKGRSAHKVMWKGAVWYFASAGNREIFETDPRRYAPQFGGYCAYAVSNGYTAKTDPEAWRIHEGRLYLNYSKAVRQLWLSDVPGHIRRANANWPGVLAK